MSMDQSSTRNGSKNKQLLATTTSIISLLSQTIQHQRLMRILKTPSSYTVPNFVQVRNLTANTDNEPHAYNPLCCDKLHGHFQPNPIVESQIEGWSINESEHHEHRQHGTPAPTIRSNNVQQVHDHFQPIRHVTKHIHDHTTVRGKAISSHIRLLQTNMQQYPQ